MSHVHVYSIILRLLELACYLDTHVCNKDTTVHQI